MKDTDTIIARKEVAKLPFREKVKYYIGYYKFHALAVVIIGIALFFFIRHQVTKETPLMYFGVLNSSQINEELLIEEMTTRLAAADRETVTVHKGLDTKADDDGESYYLLLQIYLAADELDVIFTDEEGLTYLAKSGACLDPAEWLDGELAKLWSERSVKGEALEQGSSIDVEEATYVTRDIAVDLTGTEAMKTLGLSEDTPYLLVASSSERTEQIATFMDYLYELEMQQ